ncbi:hypothetical protein CPC08DRAFT_759471 [Agrocybe pediades]|nr:hypothetical protein CPC08DRAFT_759471 [Agrocybe pediades]
MANPRPRPHKMYLPARQPCWFSEVTQQVLCVEQILSFDEVKQSMRDKLRAARDVLDAMENFQRGWFGIEEASDCLSEIFLQEPLTVRVFSTLLPDVMHLVGDWAADRLTSTSGLQSLESPIRSSESLILKSPTPPITNSPSPMDNIFLPSPTFATPASPPLPPLPTEKEHDDIYDAEDPFPSEYLLFEDNPDAHHSLDENRTKWDEVEEALRVSTIPTYSLAHEDDFHSDSESDASGSFFTISSAIEEEDTRSTRDEPPEKVELDADSVDESPPGLMSRDTLDTFMKSEDPSPLLV